MIVFGPNLRDQSKGTFVVHAADCRDCGKLRGETRSQEAASSMEAVARSVYSDQINEGSCTVDGAIDDIHFAPCVTVPRYAPNATTKVSEKDINKTCIVTTAFGRYVEGSVVTLLEISAGGNAVVSTADGKGDVPVEYLEPEARGVVVRLPDEADRIYVVSNVYGWGKGATIREALANCRKQNPRNAQDNATHGKLVYRATLAHKDSEVDGLGGITRPADFPPVDLGIVA